MQAAAAFDKVGNAAKLSQTVDNGGHISGLLRQLTGAWGPRPSEKAHILEVRTYRAVGKLLFAALHQECVC